jgi:NADH:ubiquinone oxidoreductase subunit 6 (subunit J)
MNLALLLIAGVTLVAAAVAMSLRNLIHSLLLLIASWAGIAAFYLWAGAEFVAFAQMLVYVGAVSMVVLFAVLLTRRGREDVTLAPEVLGRAISAVLVSATVLAVLSYGVLFSALPVAVTGTPVITVYELGMRLMGPFAASLLVVGVILTVALLGGVVIAATDRADKPEDAP